MVYEVPYKVKFYIVLVDFWAFRVSVIKCYEVCGQLPWDLGLDYHLVLVVFEVCIHDRPKHIRDDKSS